MCTVILHPARILMFPQKMIIVENVHWNIAAIYPSHSKPFHLVLRWSETAVSAGDTSLALATERETHGLRLSLHLKNNRLAKKKQQKCRRLI